MATDPRPALFACLLAVSIGGAVAPPAGAQSVPRSDVRVHRVVDAVSGDAIADAEVALSRSGFTIRSDSAGEFVLVLGAEDRDTLVIRKPGYLRSALLIDGGPTSPDALTVQLNPVRPSDQDSFRHVNQARYIDFVDDARRAAGLPRVRRASFSYEAETLAGDRLEVRLGRPHAVGERQRHAFSMTRAADSRVVHRGVLEV